MQWLVFSYSLPKKALSSPRVTVWRRLGRLGAIAPTSGMYVLPARDDCLEAFQWLTQEIRHAKGDAIVMRVEHFEGLNDEQLIARFNDARATEYQGIDEQAATLEKRARKKLSTEEQSEIRALLDQLRRRFIEIARVDYFDSAEGQALGVRLTQLVRTVTPTSGQTRQVPRATLAEYQDKRWVTRPRPHVDRLACAWLIRRYINPNAAIRYSGQADPAEISFDMNEATFGHSGNLCTFETMLRAFSLEDPRLTPIAEIVHEIDLRDGTYQHPAMGGVEAILGGWQQASLSDAELETHGIALFEGLYRGLSHSAARVRVQKGRRARKGGLA